jgi:large subunit ribosomal protein L10
MNRSEKQQLIDELHAELEKSPNAVLLDFKGLSVPAATEFRRKVRASGSRYRVVKNSLALRAAKGTALEKLQAKLEGTTGIAYTGDDPVALAKVLVDFAKENPALSVKGGVVAGSQLLDAEGVKALSTMPGLPELRAKLLGLLMAPAQQLVSLLNEPATQTVRVLKAHGDKLEGGQ